VAVVFGQLRRRLERSGDKSQSSGQSLRAGDAKNSDFEVENFNEKHDIGAQLVFTIRNKTYLIEN
jgi:hypothetical protein